MSHSQRPAPLGEASRSKAPALVTRARDAEVPSAIGTAPLKKAALFASFGGHVGILLGLILFALWAAVAPQPEPILKVMLVNDGSGAAGAAGGNGGGGAATASSSAASPEASKTPTRAAAENAGPPAPLAASAPTPAAAAPAPPRPDQTAALTVAALSPEEPLPLPPRRKPQPPRRAQPSPAVPAPAASAPNPTPAPPQLATVAAPQPLPGEPGQGGGPGGAAGAGAGDEGAGHGVIGSGPIAGPGDDYLDRLRRWLNRYKHYPEAAQKGKQQGHLVISFTILRNGTVTDPRVEQSSGFPLLDEAALQMLRDASPVPPLPDRYRATQLGVDLPVDFSLGFLHRLF